MSSPGFIDSLDIANRALDFLGQPPILAVDEDSVANSAMSSVYDKVRRAELRRNTWMFATRRAVLRPIDTTTRLLDPLVYDETVTYSVGALCKDTNGVIWQSTIPDNRNNTPLTTSAWEEYFGPLTVSLFDDDLTYYSGELVYVAGAHAGSYVIFMSLADLNEDDPAVATAWDATVTYSADQQVSSGGFNWRSLIEFNLNITPAVAPNDWDTDAIYSIGNTVTASDGFIYTSATNTNQGNDPTDDAVNWTASNVARGWTKTPTNYTAATTWLPIFAAASSIQIRYPIGSGPVSQAGNRNIYRLPAGYLRRAPQNPKAGSTSFLGAPSGRAYDDWEFEDKYLITVEIDPILFRFVADVTDVLKMDDMFCEGLAARMAISTCQKITQSTAKQQSIEADYKQFMTEARMVNAIEIGPEEPPEDDFVTCRI